MLGDIYVCLSPAMLIKKRLGVFLGAPAKVFANAWDATTDLT
jgi:hypothetical protein